MSIKDRMDYKVIPSCIYTNSEIASVGMTEEAKSNGKSIICNGTWGFVKIIADRKYGEILGVHIIGPRATDMTGEAALAIKL
ncbi:Pyridine nucleotide-disulphide oxidoreductase, dimerisation domain [Lutispora thermophila DSM 19022]|uniref:Pyridine nucleotide-disulphide oxidoreductase, dimerisation domain n=1 Tax=Lutispora thermophila DSM 19022 TaxID=1122184 RepID=A0A1M6E7N3_9FIRM|nr:Pyridine nucleotide-disulphide oxidoreductase, dimerisation domain [Lutispora thermophila DSM 19022]